MWSLLDFAYLLAELALSVLTTVLGGMLLSSRARAAGILFLCGGVLTLVSRAIWAVLMFRVRNGGYFGEFEYVTVISRGSWGLGIMMEGAGLLVLVLIFRAQQRRLHELEGISATISGGPSGG